MMIKQLLALTLLATLPCGVIVAEEMRTKPHNEYAGTLWEYLQQTDYRSWGEGQPIDQEFGPPACHEGATYANTIAAKTAPDYEYGSVLITNNVVEGSEDLASVTVWYRIKSGFDAKRNDWYWAVFSPEGKTIKTSADKNPHDQRGYFVQEEEGRLWVFHIHNPTLGEFLSTGDLAKRVTRIGEGPAGETLMSGDNADIDSYLKEVGLEKNEAEPMPEPEAEEPMSETPASDSAEKN